MTGREIDAEVRDCACLELELNLELESFNFA